MLNDSTIAESRHKPELDGIRGIAILAVLLCHMFGNLDLFPPSRRSILLHQILLPGWWGVDLFFALSGFLITGILLQTKQASNYYKSFYARRFLRIFPLYYVSLAAVFVTAHFVPWVHAIVPSGFIDRTLNFLYLQTWSFFWNNKNLPSNAIGPYWSLAVEEQFYLVWPSLVASLSEKWLGRVCLVGFFIGLPLRFVFMHFVFGSSPQLILTPLTRLDGLFAGAFVAVYTSRTRRPVPKHLAVAALLFGVFTLIAITAYTDGQELLISGPWMRTAGITAVALASAALIAYSQHHPPVLQKVLELSLLRKLGEYSYGLYVYHLFLFILLDKLIFHYERVWKFVPSFRAALLLSMLCLIACYFFAKLSFDLFERRFIMLKRYFPAEC